MAFLVSFDDSDEDDSSSPSHPPLLTTSTNLTTHKSDTHSHNHPSPTRAKPTPLQLGPSTPAGMNHTSTAPSHPTLAAVETPPLTPLANHTRNVSISGISATSSEQTPRGSIDSNMSDASALASPVPIKQFPFETSDYTHSTSNVIGEGLWSNVYLAHPAPVAATSSHGFLTPPITPQRRSRSQPSDSSPPVTYAIKTPTSKSARNVLTSEARIYSYLSSLPSYSKFVVPFYGQDPRSGALVLAALPQTLETHIFTDLNRLSEPARTNRLAAIFPSLALHLVRGLEFLHSSGVIHADLKPSNILLHLLPTSAIPIPFYADFSSSIPPAHLTPLSTAKTSPLGGGTWDFLSPALLSTHADPSPRTDLHALAICFLYLIFGASPFDAVGCNVFLRREMVRQNQAVHAGLLDTRNYRRLEGLAGKLGWDVRGWVERGLGVGALDIGVWRGELEGLLGGVV